jgi:hypothetical protein
MKLPIKKSFIDRGRDILALDSLNKNESKESVLVFFA